MSDFARNSESRKMPSGFWETPLTCRQPEHHTPLPVTPPRHFPTALLPAASPAAGRGSSHDRARLLVGQGPLSLAKRPLRPLLSGLHRHRGSPGLCRRSRSAAGAALLRSLHHKARENRTRQDFRSTPKAPARPYRRCFSWLAHQRIERDRHATIIPSARR
jgi:hypothetical protein